jgi:adenylate kinase
MGMVFLGAPGVGKGTQAQRLAAEEGMTQISTGEILREAVKRGTSLGLEANSYMTAGKLVPDEVVIGIIREKLKDLNDAGFILDGFPRTVAQAEALDRMLQESGGKGLDHVVNFEVPHHEIVRRLSGRRSCPSCQAVYHTEHAPPRREGTCDKCGERIVQRADDKPDTIGARLEVYEQQTRPLVEYYKRRHLLRRLDATAPINTVYENLRALVGLPRGRVPGVPRVGG